MDLMHMWDEMGSVAKGIAVILVIMSMISFGVAIERIYTFTQARKQSKLYAPQVAKHLKEGRLKDAIAISSSKNYRYSHLAKVVLAGSAGIPVPAGKRRQPEPRRPGRHRPPRHSARLGADRQRPEEGRRRRSRPSARPRRSSDCSARSSASSPRSRASRPPARAVSARSRPVSRKRSSKPRSASSSPSRRCGSTTTSPAASSTSTSRWTTRRPSSSTTSSRRRRNHATGLPAAAFGRTLKAPPASTWQRHLQTAR